MSFSQTAFRETLVYLFANVASRAVGFLMIPFYSRFLSPSEYGIIELIEVTTQVVSLLVGLGLFGSALIRIFQDYTSPKEQAVVSSTAVLGALGLNLVTISSTIVAAPWISTFFLTSPQYTTLLQATMAAMLFSNLIELCLVYVRLKRRPIFFTVYSLTALVATLALNIFFIGFQGRGVWGFVLSKVIVTSAGGLLLLVLTLRETGLHFDRPAALRMFRFGLPLVAGDVAFFVIHFGDRFFLGRMGSMAEVGNYSLAYRFGFLVTFLVGDPFGRAWGVRYCALMSQPDWAEKYRSVSRLLAFCLASVAVVIVLFSDQVLKVMVTPPYYAAIPVIPFIVFAYAVREMGDYFRRMLYIKLRSGMVSGVTIAAAILNCGLNLLWIPRFGMMGAAYSTLATWLFYAVCLYVLMVREFKVQFPLGSYAAIAGIALGCAWIGSLLSAWPTFLHYAADAVLSGAFVAAVWFLGPLGVSERSFLVEQFRALFSRPRLVPAGNRAQ